MRSTRFRLEGNLLIANGWALFRFDPDGLKRVPFVTEELGFPIQVDAAHRVIVRPSSERPDLPAAVRRLVWNDPVFINRIYYHEGDSLYLKLHLIPQIPQVSVIAVNAAGQLYRGGFLLCIRGDLRVYVHSDINPDFGFALTDSGSLVIN